MNNKFDVDALFVIMRETYSSSESSFVDATALTKVISDVGELFNQLYKLQTWLETQEDVLILQDLKRDFKKVFQMSVDAATTPVVEPVELERRFQQAFISSNSVDESKFRKSWMKSNHIVMNEKGEMEASAISEFRKIGPMIDQFADANPTFASYLKGVKEIATKLSEADDIMVRNETETPIGYEVKNNKFVFDPGYLDSIKNNLEILQQLDSSLQEELKPAFNKLIKSSIRSMKSIKSKYLKNFITETMLDVITDENNKYRMTTPIAFSSLTDVINQDFYKQFQVTKKLDLTNLEDEFTAFEMLTAGVVLTGAFANAAKSFGYLSTAGAEESLNELYLRIGELRYEASITSDEDKKAEINKKIESLNKTKDEYFKSFEFKEYRSPVLNFDTRYRFNINGENKLFDRLATQDAEGKYLVTQVFDTLTNAAIDNLKLGYLYRAAINQNTGNAVVGLVSTGLPIEAVVALLYQDVFKPLTKSKVRNAQDFVNELLSKYPQTNRVLSLEDLKNNLISPNEEVTAAAVHLFARGFKIGNDMRNLSTFLNIIRKGEVFVEKIFKTPQDLENKIGTYKDGVLRSRIDFSFVIPNMFRSAEHIGEAYQTNLELIDFIQDNWLLHDDKFIDLSKKVFNIASQTSVDDTGEEYVKIRRSFSNYLVASDPLTKQRLDEVIPKNVPLSDGASYVLSKQRTFNDELADKIQKLQNWDRLQPTKLRNAFLSSITINYNEQKVRAIKFRASVGLKPEDIAQIKAGFRSLNEYSIDENGKVSRNLISDTSVYSDIQIDLFIYALLNLGLDNVSSSFGAYLPPSMSKDVVNRYTTKLQEYIDKGLPNGLVDHLALYTALKNSAKLPSIYYEYDAPFIERAANQPAVYEGVDTVETSEGNIKIYYDRRYTTITDQNGKTKPYPKFIKSSFKDKDYAFVLVHSTPTHGYYQKIGRISDVYYTETPQDYSIASYFNGLEPTIATVSDNGKEAVTYSKLTNVVKPGMTIYITPSHNYDRSLRKKVEVISVSKSGTKTGMAIKYKDISETTTIAGTTKSVDKVLAHFAITLEEFSSYSPEEQQKLLDCHG